jgi:hypothetical protein
LGITATSDPKAAGKTQWGRVALAPLQALFWRLEVCYTFCVDSSFFPPFFA